MLPDRNETGDNALTAPTEKTGRSRAARTRRPIQKVQCLLRFRYAGLRCSMQPPIYKAASIVNIDRLGVILCDQGVDKVTATF
jgi:hypothetical protein